MQTYSAGGNLVIGFDVVSVLNEEKSQEAGRPIHEDREYITKIIPGDRNSRVHRPVTAKDKHEFSKQYEEWKRGQTEEAVEGTSLKEWPGCTRSQVEDLRYKHCHTVEQIAAMSDTLCGQLGMGYVQLRQKAKDYLEQAKGNAPLEKLRAAFDEERAQLDATRAQLQECQKELRQLKLEKGEVPPVAEPRSGRAPRQPKAS
jgi:hypothetical protein